MKNPSFFEGIIIALVSAFIGSVLFAFLPAIIGTTYALEFMISIITGSYMVYLLKRSNERTGRLVITLLWLLSSCALWLWSPGLLLFSLFNAGMIWLVRSLYFYNGILISIADLALTLFAFAAAYWAMFNTQSLFLSIWCFFLVQALFPNLLGFWKNKFKQATEVSHTDDAFNNACTVAETAIQKLSNPNLSR